MTRTPSEHSRAETTSERIDLDTIGSDPLVDSQSSEIVMAERLSSFEERYQQLLNQTERYVRELSKAGYIPESITSGISQALEQRALAPALSTLCSTLEEKSSGGTEAIAAKLQELRVAAREIRDFAGQITDKIDPETGDIHKSGISIDLLTRSVELRLTELEDDLIITLDSIVSELPVPLQAEDLHAKLLKLTEVGDLDTMEPPGPPEAPEIPLEKLLASSGNQQSFIAPESYFNSYDRPIPKGFILEVGQGEQPHQVLAIQELLVPTDGLGGHTDLSAITEVAEPQLVTRSSSLLPGLTTISYQRRYYDNTEHIPFPLEYAPHQYRFVGRDGAPITASGQLHTHQHGFGIAEWPEEVNTLEVNFTQQTLYTPTAKDREKICQYGGQHAFLLNADELREQSLLKRLESVVESYKQQRLIYDKGRAIGELIQASGKHMHPFFEGFGVGDCKLLSYQLASTLNALGIPAVVAGGQAVTGSARRRYTTPGHRHVIVYAPHPIKLDPTLWCDDTRTIDPNHPAFHNMSERLLQAGSPEEAYRYGKELREAIATIKTSGNGAGNDNGHQLNDDSHKLRTDTQTSHELHSLSPQELAHLHHKIAAKVRRLIDLVSDTASSESRKLIDELYCQSESNANSCLMDYLEGKHHFPEIVSEIGELIHDAAYYYCQNCSDDRTIDDIFNGIFESQFRDYYVESKREYQLIETYLDYQESSSQQIAYYALEKIILNNVVDHSTHPALFKRALKIFFQRVSLDLHFRPGERKETLGSLFEHWGPINSIIDTTDPKNKSEIQEIVLDFIQRETTIEELTEIALLDKQRAERIIDFLQWTSNRSEYRHLFNQHKKFSSAMGDAIRASFYPAAALVCENTSHGTTQLLAPLFESLLYLENRIGQKISLAQGADQKDDFATLYRRSMERTDTPLALYSECATKIALAYAQHTREIHSNYSGELVLLLARERDAIDQDTMMELWKEYRHPVEIDYDGGDDATSLLMRSLGSMVEAFYCSLEDLSATPASDALCYALASAERNFILKDDPAYELFDNKNLGFVVDHDELTGYESDSISDTGHLLRDWGPPINPTAIGKKVVVGALAHIRSQLENAPGEFDTLRYQYALLSKETDALEMGISTDLHILLDAERRWSKHYDDAIAIHQGITAVHPERSHITFLNGATRQIPLRGLGNRVSPQRRLMDMAKDLQLPRRFDANALEQKLLNDPSNQKKARTIGVRKLNSDGIPQKRPGHGQDYLESRPYQQGDDLRRIDWRAFAKTDKYHTKVNAAESAQLESGNLLIQVDASSIPCDSYSASQSLLTLMNYIYAGVRAGRQIKINLHFEGVTLWPGGISREMIIESTSSKNDYSLLERIHKFGYAANSITRDAREKFPYLKRPAFIDPFNARSHSILIDGHFQEAQPVLACTSKALQRLREEGINIEKHLFLELPEEEVYTPSLSHLVETIREVNDLDVKVFIAHTRLKEKIREREEAEKAKASQEEQR